MSTSNTITIETTTSTSSPQHCHSGGIVGVAVGVGVNVSSAANVGLGSIGIGSTLCSSGDSGISSSTPSLVSQLSPPPTIICSLPTSTNSNNIAISGSVGAAISSSAVAAGRCSPIIAGSYCALTNGLAGISVSSHTTTTSIYGGSGSGSNSNRNIISKPKSSLSPLQRLPISGNLSTYGSSGGGGSLGCGGGVSGSGPGFTLLTGSNSHLSSISPALSASTPLSSGMSGGGSNNATNYLSSMKLLGPASIDLGTTPLTHRNYSTIKGFSFRRSFDDKIIAPLNSSSSGGVGVGSGGGIGGHSNYLTHHHFHTHFHHPTSAMQKQSSIDRHMSGGGGGMGVMSHSTHYPLTSSQSSTKLSYRDDFLQQIGYLPTTRIFNTSIDEDRQQEFLSLSMSPPLNRRRDMPALRGIISL